MRSRHYCNFMLHEASVFPRANRRVPAAHGRHGLTSRNDVCVQSYSSLGGYSSIKGIIRGNFFFNKFGSYTLQVQVLGFHLTTHDILQFDNAIATPYRAIRMKESRVFFSIVVLFFVDFSHRVVIQVLLEKFN